jgi:hypothetical protein
MLLTLTQDLELTSSSLELLYLPKKIVGRTKKEHGRAIGGFSSEKEVTGTTGL